jgi:hypothetical protein
MNELRKWMRLAEAVMPQRFYHGSGTELPVGTVLTARGAAYEADWIHTDFYEVLERYRPANMLAHKDAVFMCDNPDDVDNAGGSTDWLFTVEPLGQVQRHDLNWSSEISLLLSDEAENSSSWQLQRKLQKAAENYWNGVPHHSENVWEYLTPSAKNHQG